MKYLSVFATESAYAAEVVKSTFARPHVSLVEETSSVKFDKAIQATPGQGPEINPDNPEHNFGEDLGEGQL
jgi:hypothetical protein